MNGLLDITTILPLFLMKIQMHLCPILCANEYVLMRFEENSDAISPFLAEFVLEWIENQQLGTGGNINSPPSTP